MSDRKQVYFERFDQLALSIADQVGDVELSNRLFIILSEARDQLQSISEEDPNFETVIYAIAYDINRVSSIVSKESELKRKEDQVVARINSILDELAKCIDSQEEVDSLFDRLKNARKALLDAKLNKEVTLEEAEFIIKSVESRISISKQSRDEDAALRIVVPLIINVYIFGIIAIILFADKSVWNSMSLIPLIEIPLSVFLWAALGSLAAILYRFYTKKFDKIGTEIKWLIARPIVGMIMGSLGYIAIISGLFIFRAESELENLASIYIYCIVSFLGGFSDKFFEAIIQSLTGKFTSGSSD